jgi:lipoprotein NlpI
MMIGSLDQSPVIVRSSPWKLVRLLAFAVALAAGGLYTLTHDLPFARAAIYVPIAGAVFRARHPGPSILTLAPDGLISRTMWATHRYCWLDVKDFRAFAAVRGPGAKHVGFDLAEDPWPNRFYYRHKVMTGVHVSLGGGWELGAAELAALLNEARTRWLGHEPAQPTPFGQQGGQPPRIESAMLARVGGMEMRLAKFALIVCAALLALSFVLMAAADNDRVTCIAESGDVAIAACSRAIASGRYEGLALADLHLHRGLASGTKRDLDCTIADLDQAIRLNPEDAWAHNIRGNAWSYKGDLDRAIADYDQAIGLVPNYPVAYINRGNTWRDKGDLDRAIADFNEAIRLDPKDSRAYLNRGRTNLYARALAEAVADLSQASELNPKYAYTALWLDIASKRSNLPSGLPEATEQIDMTKWPAPIIRLYLGESTPEAVLAAAADPNAQTENGQVCEANFYSGELALQQGKKDEAERLLRLAAAGCPKNFTEYGGANAELKALGATP